MKKAAPGAVAGAMQHPEKIAVGSRVTADFVTGAPDPGPPPTSWAGAGGYAVKTGLDWHKDRFGR